VTAESRPVAVEAKLARNTVARAVYVGPLLIALFWITRGWTGAWSSAVGVAVVIANFLAAGAILSISARISLAAYHAAALLGFFLRLGLLTLTMLVIASLMPIDRLAFGITAVVAYLVLIGAEAVAVAKGKERELEWT
jgi:hypothetical protein